MILLKLFLVFLRVGFFAIGGAYSFLPLLEKELVQNHQWIDKAEFMEVVGMAEIFPGAISIKFATYTGCKVVGVPGAIVANLANLLPPVLCMLLASLVYAKYRNIAAIKAGLEMVRYAVFAMIIAITIELIDKNQVMQVKYLVVIFLSFVLFTLTKVQPCSYYRRCQGIWSNAHIMSLRSEVIRRIMNRAHPSLVALSFCV
jgi:chromate transporter